MRAPEHVPRHPVYTNIILDYLEEADDLLTIADIERAFMPRERWVEGRRLDKETIESCLNHLLNYKAVDKVKVGRRAFFMATRETDTRVKSFSVWAELKNAHNPPEVSDDQG